MTISSKDSYKVTSLSSTECRIKTGGIAGNDIGRLLSKLPAVVSFVGPLDLTVTFPVPSE